MSNPAEPQIQIHRYTVGGSDDYSLKFDPGDLALMESRPTIFIGLGGTGSRAVSMVKHLFLETFRGRMQAGADELPQCYRFLAFDSTPNAPQHLSPRDEYFQLSGSGLTPERVKQIANEPGFVSWTKKKFRDLNPTQGCSGFRNLGRFLLWQPDNLQLVSTKIWTALADANRGLKDVPTPVFYIFCTLAGGTGSGLLIDVCAMIRERFPDPKGARVVLLLGIVEGLQGEAKLVRRARHGCYAALRELDMLQSEDRRGEWLEREARRDPRLDPTSGSFTYPSGGVTARYANLSQEIFLFSPTNAVSETTLPDSGSISIFMARCVFALSTYPVPTGAGAGGGQPWEEILNNRLEIMAESEHGANCCYIAPSFTSVVLPVEQVFNLFNFAAAEQLLGYLSGGEGNPGHQREAEEFLIGAFDERSLGNFFEKGFEKEVLDESIPGLNQQPQLRAPDVAKVARYLDRQADYEKASKASELKSPLENLCERNLDAEWFKEIEKEFTRTDKTSLLGEISTLFETRLHARARELLLNRDYRALGAIDFLNDVAVLLKNMSSAQTVIVRKQKKALTDAKADCKNGVLKRLSTLCKPGGVFEFMEARRLRQEYPQAVEELYALVKSWVRAALVERALKELSVATDRFLAMVSNTVNKTAAARNLLRQKINELERQLFRWEQRQGSKLEDLHTVSLLDAAWRARFVEQTQLNDTGVLFAMVAPQRGGRTDDPGWTFLTPCESLPSGETPTPSELGDSLCGRLFEAIAPMANRFLVWKGGAGFSAALAYSGRDRAESYQHMRNLINTTIQAQIEFDTAAFGVTTGAPITVFAGPPEITTEIYADAAPPMQLNHALTYEANRIVLFAAFPQIALPMCAMVRRLDTEWTQFEAEARKKHPKESGYLDELQGVHSLARSWEELQAPAYFWKSNENSQALAAALLTGLSCPVAKPPADCPATALLAELKNEYEKPVTKKLGIFRDPEGSVWLAPNRVEKSQGLHRQSFVALGNDMATACSRVFSDDLCLTEAKAWQEWLIQHSRQIFPSKLAFREALKSALESLKQYAAAETRNPNSARRWRQLADEAEAVANQWLLNWVEQ